MGERLLNGLVSLQNMGRGCISIRQNRDKGFHSEVWQEAHSVMFFQGRLKFCRVDGSVENTANAPSVLVAYSKCDTESLRVALDEGTLKGKLVIL